MKEQGYDMTAADKQAVSRFVNEFMALTSPIMARDYHGAMMVWIRNYGLDEEAALSARSALFAFCLMKGIPIEGAAAKGSC